MSGELRVLVGVAAGVISLAGFVPYLASTFAGKTRPNRATWWIWTVVGTMLGASYYASGARASAWVALSYVVGPLVTAIVSLWRGEGGWSRFDRACIAGAAVSALLWWTSGSPLVALLINVLIDALGALPTIRKTWRDPSSENRLAWSLSLGGNALNLLAVEAWTFAQALYPVYLCVVGASVTALAFRRVPADRAPASIRSDA